MTKRLNALSQLIQLGIRRTSNSLGRISGIPWVGANYRDNLEELHEVLAFSSEQYVLSFSSERGHFLVLFSPKSAIAVSNSFIAQESEWLEDQPELVESFGLETLSEISNILIHGVVNTLADACGDAILLSSPKLACGSSKDVEAKITKLGQDHPTKVWFQLRSETADCIVVIFLDHSWTRKLLSAVVTEP